jgi:hypothetical protein
MQVVLGQRLVVSNSGALTPETSFFAQQKPTLVTVNFTASGQVDSLLIQRSPSVSATKGITNKSFNPKLMEEWRGEPKRVLIFALEIDSPRNRSPIHIPMLSEPPAVNHK